MQVTTDKKGKNDGGGLLLGLKRLGGLRSRDFMVSAGWRG
jgi:hypothetical protein